MSRSPLAAPTSLLLLALLSASCGDKDGVDTGGGGAVTDADGDGYAPPRDCDDADPSVHPGAADTCNGVDDDCDGELDEDPELLWYADADGDGFGDPDAALAACEQPSGYVANRGDCDDADAGVYPGHAETCDGVDQDCDGVPDDGLAVYVDASAGEDGDGSIEAPYTEISRAVESGATCISVAPGTYGPVELVDVGEPVYILSQEGRDATTIDAAGAEHALLVDGQGSVAVDEAPPAGAEPALLLRGFTLTGGTAYGSYPQGGGLLLLSARVELEDVRVEANRAYNGGGIAVLSGELVARDLEITGNEASYDGGGLFLSSASFEGEEVTITSNIAVDPSSLGGGIYVTASDLLLQGGELARNTAGEAVGGLAAYYGSSVELVQLRIVENSAPYVGAVYLAGAEAFLQNAVLDANEAWEDYASALAASTGSLVLDHATLAGNWGPLAAVQLWGASSLVIGDSILAFNGGCGLYVDDEDSWSAITYSGADIYGNEEGAVCHPDWGGAPDEELRRSAGTPPPLPGDVLQEDPLFVDFVDDGVGDDDLHLAQGSPCVDAGQGEPDPDGSPSDLGAYGGPGGDW